MVSESSGERVQPVLLTAQPSSSSQGRRSSIWVERPTPSVPSIAIRCPGRGGIFRYGRPLPYQRLPALAGAIPALRCEGALVPAEHLLHHAADDALLRRDVAGRVDHAEVELPRELVIDVEDAALEEPEALHRVGRQPEVHSRLVILELGAPAEEA